MSKIIDFYIYGKKNMSGVYLNEILNYNEFKLENKHDFIQWIFPLNEESFYNSNAPILTNEDITILKSSEIFKKNMILAFKKMLDYYGLYIDEEFNEIILYSNFKEKYTKRWITINNHNYLRITRILKSLKIFGFEDYSRSFFYRLTYIYREYYKIIGMTSYLYWSNAIYGGNEIIY